MREHTKAALQAWLRQNGLPVVHAITGGVTPSRPIGVHLVRERAGVGVFEIDCDGRKAVVKAFDNRSEEARTACEREAFALHRLRDKGLVPRLITYAPAEAFIVSEYVPGARVDTILNDDTLLDLSRRIGAWLARYIAHQPTRKLELDWYSYFTQSGGVITDAVRAEAHTRFGTNRIAQFALAKNDLAPENFILKDDGTLIGIDFERSRFKPVGWDVIAAAWVLIKRFPGREADFVPALVQGWQGARAAQAPKDFEALATFFAMQAQGLNWKRAPYRL